MRVKQKQNSQPNFGLKIIQTKEFEKFSAETGLRVPMKKLERTLNARFPRCKDVFELSPHIILAEKKQENLGPTYHFAKANFKSTKEIEQAIITTIKARTEMRQLPKFVRALNKKFGTKIEFNPGDICLVAGNNVRAVKNMLLGVASGISSIRNSKDYKTTIYNNGSSNRLSLNIKRDSEYFINDFLFRSRYENSQEAAKKITRQAVGIVIETSRTNKNAARAQAKAEALSSNI